MKTKELFSIANLKSNKALYGVGIASAVAALLTIPLWLFDPRDLAGVSVWEKPLKFFLSTVIFALTYSWLSSFIHIGKKYVALLSKVLAVSLVTELVLITAVAATGNKSHFNVSSPLAIAIWAAMAIMISVVLTATVILSVLILIDSKQKPILRWALALGSLNTSIGMALAFLMTGPTRAQLANFEGIAGAHTVGSPDGGPGLPLLGWSLNAGDLRVGHFFGLHSIQIAILLLVLQLVMPKAWKLPTVVVGNFAYLGFVLLVTAQALQAEPFVSPGEWFWQYLWILSTVAATLWAGWSLTNQLSITKRRS